MLSNCNLLITEVIPLNGRAEEEIKCRLIHYGVFLSRRFTLSSLAAPCASYILPTFLHLRLPGQLCLTPLTMRMKWPRWEIPGKSIKNTMYLLRIFPCSYHDTLICRLVGSPKLDY